MKKTAKSWAMLHTKCPRCRRGNMFEGKIYHFGSNKINIHCPRCEMIFEIEPGYFYAAMYVSYAMNMIEGGMLCYLTYLITGSESPWLYSSVIILGLFVLSPVNFRYSRVFLLYWLSPKVHYHPDLDIPTPAGSGTENSNNLKVHSKSEK